MSSRNAGGQIIKSGIPRVTLDADWDGTTSTVELDGDRPIVGLAINLSAGGTLTFHHMIGVAAFTILANDGTALSIDASSITELYRFYPELAGVRTLRITCSASQTDATVEGFFSS